MKVIVYRVHKDVIWEEREGFQNLVPTEKVRDKDNPGCFLDIKGVVLEEDFLLGKVCSPAEANNWSDKYSIPCKCVKNDRMNKLLKSSEITDEFKKLGFGNFQTGGKPQSIIDAYETSYEYFCNFIENKSKKQNSIALLGNPGSGKTHLLTAVSNNLMRKQLVAVLYFPFVEGFDDLRDDFDLLKQKLEHMKTIDVLFIDDLFKPVNGKPRASKFEIEKMYAVINYRYLNKKPILVSSELTVDELIKVDEALGTRIYEMCEDYIVQIVGDPMELNHRLKSLKSL